MKIKHPETAEELQECLLSMEGHSEYLTNEVCKAAFDVQSEVPIGLGQPMDRISVSWKHDYGDEYQIIDRGYLYRPPSQEQHISTICVHFNDLHDSGDKEPQRDQWTMLGLILIDDQIDTIEIYNSTGFVWKTRQCDLIME